MGDARHRFEVGHDAAGIGQALDEDRAAFRRQRPLEILRIGLIDEDRVPAEFLEGPAELGERAAIELVRGEEARARLHEREKGQELRGMARRRADGAAPAFQAGDPLFQHRHGRVGQARIDVAIALQIEQRGGVIDIVEDIGGRLIDRRDARAGRRVGRCPGMDGAGLETEGALFSHGACSP